jgi:hypothetical protein
MIPPLFGKQEVEIWRVQKCFPQYGIPIWSLWPNIRFLSSIAFLDPSDSYFLIAEERGYHKWALAHSSSCYFQSLYIYIFSHCIFIFSVIVYFYFQSLYIFIFSHCIFRSRNASHDMGYLYEACDQISDFCPQ